MSPDAGGSAWDRLARALDDLDAVTRAGATAAAPPHGEGAGPQDDDDRAPQDGSGHDRAGSWTGAGGAHSPSGGRVLADQLSELLQAWQQNLQAHTGPECRVCPVCQAVALLRQTRPEVLEHLVGAAGELAAALRLVVGQPQGSHPGGHTTGSRGSMPVERIDVTD